MIVGAGIVVFICAAVLQVLCISRMISLCETADKVMTEFWTPDAE